MSELRRRLMMQSRRSQATGGIFWFKGNGKNPVDLFSQYFESPDALTIEIVDTGEIIDARATNQHIFNNTKENAVLINFRNDLTSLDSLFYSCAFLLKFEDGVFSGLTNITEVDSLFCGCYSCTFTDEKLFENNPNIKIFDYCFQMSSIDILPRDKYGYLWDRPGVSGNQCFFLTPAADMFGDGIPYDWV